MADHHGDFRTVAFIRPCLRDDYNSTPKEEKLKPVSNLDGNEVKDFYETVISQGSTPKPGTSSGKEPNSSTATTLSVQKDEKSLIQKRTKVKKNTKVKYPKVSANSCSVRNLEQLKKSLLASSQHGDLEEVKKCVEEGADMDSSDIYGWTALMCAACSGHRKIVSFLIESGANVKLKNNQSKTALDLAKVSRHDKTVKVLTQGVEYRTSNPSSPQSEVKTVQKLYCDICKCDYEGDQKVHDTSMMHLFNRKHKTEISPYFLPESNRGFQMMLKTGWDGEKGLGSQGQGQKLPVKTVLKRSRAGLGMETKDKKKVTHFNAKDKEAIKHPKGQSHKREMRPKTISKKAAQKKLTKEKRWEIKMRREFNSD